MFRTMIGNLAAVLAVTAAPVQAQDWPLSLPTEALLALAERPDLDRAPFERALNDLLPSTAVERDLSDLPFQDPYLWFFIRTLGGPGPDAGRTLACSRHGVATREWFAENRLGSVDGILLQAVVAPLQDQSLPDWPEGAVAQVHCEFILGLVDQSVAGLTEAQVRDALSMFQSLSVPMDPETGQVVYGADGFAVEGTGGDSNSVAHVGKARIARLHGVQILEFSSFLLASGS